MVLTGGGSNLFQLPLDEHDVSQEQINDFTAKMQEKGASRVHSNLIRRHLSAIKGGRFAIMMQQTKILTLIISDVIGDLMDTIACGPTFPEKTTPVMCLDILKKFQMDAPEIKNYLEKRSEEEEMLKRNSEDFSRYLPAHRDIKEFRHVQNIMLANNRDLILGSVAKAEKLGYRSLELSNQEFGDIKDKAQLFAKLFPFLCRLLRRKLEQPDKFLAATELELVQLGLDKAKAKEIAVRANVAVNTSSGLCVVVGGEFTCKHQPDGNGGVYQELAIHVARLLHQQKENRDNMTEEFECIFLSFDTDGIDGNSVAAGAWVNADTVERALKFGLSPLQAIESSNSYKFFTDLEGGRYHIVTGHIALDLMGLVLLLVRPRHLDSGIQTIKDSQLTDNKQ